MEPASKVARNLWKLRCKLERRCGPSEAHAFDLYTPPLNVTVVTLARGPGGNGSFPIPGNMVGWALLPAALEDCRWSLLRPPLMPLQARVWCIV
jgi:hypothetical protein